MGEPASHSYADVSTQGLHPGSSRSGRDIDVASNAFDPNLIANGLFRLGDSLYMLPTM